MTMRSAFSGITLTLCATIVAAAPAPPAFRTVQTFDVGPAPSGLVAADFNGDGRADLVVANGSTHALSILINRTPAASATAAFDARFVVPLAASPISIAAADLDGDGAVDIATSNLDGNSISLFRNAMDAGGNALRFEQEPDLATGRFPNAFAATDLDGDGRVDLVVANYEDDTISVFRNATMPGSRHFAFSAPRVFGTGLRPHSIGFADVNSDGRPDIFVGNHFDASVNVYLNYSSAGSPLYFNLQAVSMGSYAGAMIATDLNADGRPDIAVAASGSDEIAIRLDTMRFNDPALSFAPRQTVPSLYNANLLLAADVNDDGSPDLVFTGEFERSLLVRANASNPWAWTPHFAEPVSFDIGGRAYPDALIAADFDRDGSIDLATSNYVGGTVSILLNAAQRPDPLFADGFD
jgi:hypothetical protein